MQTFWERISQPTTPRVRLWLIAANVGAAVLLFTTPEVDLKWAGWITVGMIISQLCELRDA